MNKENASKLWKIIQEAGDYLKGQLPGHPNHPKAEILMLMLRYALNQNFKKVIKILKMKNFKKL